MKCACWYLGRLFLKEVAPLRYFHGARTRFEALETLNGDKESICEYLLHCVDQVLDGGEDVLVDILQSVFLVIVGKPIAMDDLHLLDERTFPRLSCPKQQKLQLFPERSYKSRRIYQALTATRLSSEAQQTNFWRNEHIVFRSWTILNDLTWLLMPFGKGKSMGRYRLPSLNKN
jgi:hypothetical protein